MGGRGSSGGFSAGGVIHSANDAKTYDQLERYLLNNGFFYINITQSAKDEIPVEAVARGIDAIGQLYQELGLTNAAPIVKDINADEKRKDAMMSASYWGDVQFNPAFYSAEEFKKADDRVRQSNNSGWHPHAKDFTADMHHELGHQIEAYLISKEFGNRPGVRPVTYDAVKAWSKHTIATRIIREAAQNLKRQGVLVDRLAWSTPDGKIGWDMKTLSSTRNKVDDYVGSVSGYARKNRGECLAECVSDYMQNGNKANPLSREVFKILKREVNK